MIEARLRTRIPAAELDDKVGKVLGPEDYNLMVTGPCRLLRPNGQPLLVYLPGALRHLSQDDTIYGVLHSLKSQTTVNRGAASGTRRVKPGTTRSHLSYAKAVPSAIIGALDGASGYHKYCRLTAWTGKNVPEWETLHPFLRSVADHFQQHVPDRYEAQMREVARTVRDWVVPGTPFSTVTVNNTYPTGVHQDAGDLAAGFSTLATVRRGTYTGGHLVFPRYRVALDMADGDLVLMDAHEHHGNTPLVCVCGDRLNGPCGTCDAERISLVSYFREAMVNCGTPAEEFAEASRRADERTAKPSP